MQIPFLRKYQLGLLSIASGLLLGMAWPVNGFAPLIFIALVPLLLAETSIRRNPDSYSRGAVVLYSFITFLIFNVFTTWWVSNSTLVGSLLAFILNSLFMALTFGFSHWIDKQLFGKKAGVFTLIFLWVSFEYLHMQWDLSWSWLNLGNVFSENPNWVQWYEYTGVLGGSIWVLFINGLIHRALQKGIDHQLKMQYSILPFTIALMLIFAPIILSYQIKKNVVEGNEMLHILAIQPNIEPYEEAYNTSQELLVNNLLQITRANMDDQTTLVICPESSLERSMWESSIEQYSAIDSIRRFIYQHPNISFLMGASTRRRLEDGEEVKAYARPFYNDSTHFYYRYNSALFIQQGQPIAFYHKSRLVPGVERMPFAALLKPIEKYAIDLGGTTGSLGVSTEPVLFNINGSASVAPIICYESIYGELVGSFFDKRNSFIAVITNDAWWLDTPGYKQHFSYGRLRAIESRKTVVRSANTGVSGVINAKGEVLQHTNFYERTAVKAQIALNNTQTYYSKAGDYLGRLSLFMVALILLVLISRSMRKK